MPGAHTAPGPGAGLRKSRSAAGEPEMSKEQPPGRAQTVLSKKGAEKKRHAAAEPAALVSVHPPAARGREGLTAMRCLV